MSDGERPNVVFVMTDQQSATMLGCAGNDHVETPNIDRLAATGTRFERAYCTNPVCLPSRTSLLTGRFPTELGLRSNDYSHLDGVPDRVVDGALGNCLRAAGYETAYAGRTHFPGMTPEDLGFEYLTDDERDGAAAASAEFVRGDHEEPFFLFSSFINPHDICYMGIRDYQQTVGEWEGGTAAERKLDEALALPDDVDREAFVTERCPPLPPNHEPQADEPGAVDALLDERPFRRHVREEWSTERWRHHRWAYARLTEVVDAQVGQIIDALEESGHRENTVVIFSSDHGDHDGAHRLEHKTLPYEEAARIPFLVSDPRTEAAGATDDRLVSNGLDLLPTVCDYAGATPPDHCDGRSVRPPAEGRAVDWRDAVRVESQVGDAVVTDRYKYVRYDRGDSAEQLYDLATDPGETRNAAGDPEHADALADLRGRL
jgi:choline-sulfatase